MGTGGNPTSKSATIAIESGFLLSPVAGGLDKKSGCLWPLRGAAKASHRHRVAPDALERGRRDLAEAAVWEDVGEIPERPPDPLQLAVHAGTSGSRSCIPETPEDTGCLSSSFARVTHKNHPPASA